MKLNDFDTFEIKVEKMEDTLCSGAYLLKTKDRELGRRFERIPFELLLSTMQNCILYLVKPMKNGKNFIVVKYVGIYYLRNLLMALLKSMKIFGIGILMEDAMKLLKQFN